jgi:hypothetical protein
LWWSIGHHADVSVQSDKGKVEPVDNQQIQQWNWKRILAITYRLCCSPRSQSLCRANEPSEIELRRE